MKRILPFLLVFLLIAVAAIAAKSVTFEWDPNTEPDLAGYRLYQSDVSGAHVFGKILADGTPNPDFLVEIICGPNDSSCCTYTKAASPGPGKYYVATAFDQETAPNESLPSNEVETLPPGKVKNLRK